METIYERIQVRAREIVSRFPVPDFYKDFAETNEFSRHFLNTNQDILILRKIVSKHLDNDFGHGLQHAEKVTLDAGALILIEGRRSGYSEKFMKRRMFIVQCAGLLHDIMRKQENHAIIGAEFAGKILKDFPLTSAETHDVCSAIRSHEAFKKKIRIDSPAGELVSDCLYDADKFRWGPDNFTDTLWNMVSYLNPPLPVFLEKFPKGMASLEKIKLTFQTHTGIRYGPQFIDIGIAAGKELYQVIKKEFVSI
jgi:hypothetical protein